MADKTKAVRFRDDQLKKSDLVQDRKNMSFSEQVRKAYDFFWMDAVYPLALENLTKEEAEEKMEEEVEELKESKMDIMDIVNFQVFFQRMGEALCSAIVDLDKEDVNIEEINIEEVEDIGKFLEDILKRVDPEKFAKSFARYIEEIEGRSKDFTSFSDMEIEETEDE